MYKKINRCLCCDSKNLYYSLNLNEQPLANSYIKDINDEENIFSLEISKDLSENFTQYYNLKYTHQTDCISIDLNYNKSFFRDGSLVPDESLYFLIRFIPFAELRGSANTIFEMKKDE